VVNFKMALENIIKTDVLVIGGGMAGCFAAIKAREQDLDVTLVDKGIVGKTGATHFSWGDFALLNPERGYQLDEWMELININSEYLNNREWGEIVLKDSYERYKDLVAWGVRFYQHEDKTQVYRGGVHGHVTMFNREYAPALRRRAIKLGVRILNRIMIGELLKQGRKVVGAVGFNTTSGDLYIFNAGAVVMAAGSSSLKSASTPIHYWTSDAEAMAYRAGAEITGKEFMWGNEPALRSVVNEQVPAGKVEINNTDDVLARYPSFPGGLSNAILRPTVNAEGGPVNIAAWEAHSGRAPLYVDLDAFSPEQKESLHHFFERMETAEADKIGLDVFKSGKLQYPAGRLEVTQPFPGGSGIRPVNDKCSTAIPGLFAAGDSCATMLSGASYAGIGMGLCHAAVTGTRAGLGAAEYASTTKRTTIDDGELASVKKVVYAPMERKGGFSPRWVTQVLQSIATPYFILEVKHGERLQAALVLIEFLYNHIVPKLMARDNHEWRMAHETRNMILNTEMVLRASLFRTESRGGHFREDYSRRDDPAWLAWVNLKEEQGKMEVSKQPIPEKWWPDLSRPYEERYPRMFPGE
jgi:succinate dehydrogenase/fumarate reductase flavoprotein subunit